MVELWEVVWKVVIHRKKAGVHPFSQELHTFQTTSYKLDRLCVANQVHSVPCL